MPQINLLTSEETKRHTLPWEIILTVLVRLCFVAFLALIAYYGFLVYRTKSITQQTATTQDSIAQKQNELLTDQNRRELLVRQGQMHEAAALLAKHQYWSKFLPELARVTLKSSAYLAFSTTDKGTARFAVSVPSYTELDEFLQVFDLPDYYQNFSDVKVTSVSKYQIGDLSGLKFEVELKYNPQFLVQKSNQK